MTPETKDSELALYVRDLAYAGRDCRAQLSEIGETLNLQPDIDVTDVLVTQEKKKKRFGIF